MGAYEFGIGDSNCDGTVGLDDLADFAVSGCLTGPNAGPYPEGCAPFDFDGDFDAELQDFALWQLQITGP